MPYLKFPPYSKLPELPADDRLELLFYCIRSALYAGLTPLDRYLNGIFPNSLIELAGGDAGWYLDLNSKREEVEYPEQWDACIARSSLPELGCYEAWAMAGMSGIEPETAYYTIEEVSHYIRITLDLIAIEHPDRAKEVREVIARYRLNDAG